MVANGWQDAANLSGCNFPSIITKVESLEHKKYTGMSTKVTVVWKSSMFFGQPFQKVTEKILKIYKIKGIFYTLMSGFWKVFTQKS